MMKKEEAVSCLMIGGGESYCSCGKLMFGFISELFHLVKGSEIDSLLVANVVVVA